MTQVLTEPDVRDRVKNLNWVHSIDLGNGVVTPGRWGTPNPLIKRAFDDTTIKGKKVLDIGCWDGLWSFEAERRGASEVHATDLVSQRSFSNQPTFATAHEILKSRAQYNPNVSVFELKEQLGITDFDVVVYCGIYYHLKDPLLAFARIREVMKTGGILIVEGDVIDDEKHALAHFFYRKKHVDGSNWWVPTIACLREWVECSLFEIVDEYPDKRYPATPLTRLKSAAKKALGYEQKLDTMRYVMRVRAVNRAEPKYRNYPDPHLSQFTSEVK